MTSTWFSIVLEVAVIVCGLVSGFFLSDVFGFLNEIPEFSKDRCRS